MRRQIHLHVGPTNSGKTYAAIQRLKAADSGVYCSPLRLLAWEVAEGLNNAPDGVPCQLGDWAGEARVPRCETRGVHG